MIPVSSRVRDDSLVTLSFVFHCCGTAAQQFKNKSFLLTAAQVHSNNKVSRESTGNAKYPRLFTHVISQSTGGHTAKQHVSTPFCGLRTTHAVMFFK